MVAGTSTSLTTVASIRIATARPSPSIFTVGSSPSTNPENTETMISAAHVMTRAVLASPCTIASWASPVSR